MMCQEIKDFVRKEVRTQLAEKLKKKPREICRECHQRLSQVEKQVKTIASEKSSRNVAEGTAPQKRHYRITGEHLHKIREQFDLTQEEIALLLETTLTTVNRWERGRVLPCSRMQQRIAELRSGGKRSAHRRLKELKKPQQADNGDKDESILQ
ncbi:helix-turn-helix domain-containing protein [Victivallis sp. Marseille-Q1083]|uniref:helix-turn-helix domain-containing protein n=1 Tax=Victivallis sp. Marseille-Q1083 TaxID=2717288 RepID=UPI00158E9251|nr:helix-turn-helix domain-containing protein [Victivallis sp. Marseille-Q1083]